MGTHVSALLYWMGPYGRRRRACRVLKQISAPRVLSPPWREEKRGLNKRARVTAGGGRATAGDWFFGEGRLNDMLATTDR